MNRLFALALIVVLTSAASVAKSKERVWKTGRVLDSQSAKTFVQAGASMAIQDTQLMIVADDFLYVVNDEVQKGTGLNGSLARAIINRKHGCHVIINDPVQYSEYTAALYLKDVDGKECKMEIVRQERVTKVAPQLKP